MITCGAFVNKHCLSVV